MFALHVPGTQTAACTCFPQAAQRQHNPCDPSCGYEGSWHMRHSREPPISCAELRVSAFTGLTHVTWPVWPGRNAASRRHHHARRMSGKRQAASEQSSHGGPCRLRREPHRPSAQQASHPTSHHAPATCNNLHKPETAQTALARKPTPAGRRRCRLGDMSHPHAPPRLTQAHKSPASTHEALTC